jgi:hypothetical protein
VWVDLRLVTHSTVGGHLNSYLIQSQGASELKAKLYAKAFRSMPAAAFRGFGLDTCGAWVGAQRSLSSCQWWRTWRQLGAAVDDP